MISAMYHEARQQRGEAGNAVERERGGDECEDNPLKVHVGCGQPCLKSCPLLLLLLLQISCVSPGTITEIRAALSRTKKARWGESRSSAAAF